jgi:hypothetical protein
LARATSKGSVSNVVPFSSPFSLPGERAVSRKEGRKRVAEAIRKLGLIPLSLGAVPL